jgi:hypothetical protein
MSEKLNVYQKVNKAIEKIKKSSLKKTGYNTHSKYYYFTPEDVEAAVDKGIDGLGLFIKFDLVRTELGIDGRLEVLDIDSGENISYIMASAIPSITATNASQQLGGAMTYTERYMLMNAFKIKDNSLDPDNTDNTKKRESKKQDEVKRTLTQKDVEKWNGKIYSDKFVYIDNVKIEVPVDQITKLKAHAKYKEDGSK